MPDRSELEALLRRVMNDAGQDWRLHEDMLELIRSPALSEEEVAALNARGLTGFSGCIIWNYGDVTTSVDAALALVERCLPGWRWKLWFGTPIPIHVEAMPPAVPGQLDHTIFAGNARSLPLAILAALLRALIAESHPAEPLKHMPA